MSFEFDKDGGIIDKAAQSFADRKQALASVSANQVNGDGEVVQVFDEAPPSEEHDAEPAVDPEAFAAELDSQDNNPVGDAVEQPQTPAEEQTGDDSSGSKKKK